MNPPRASGASLMLLTVLAFVVQDAAVKFLVGAYGVMQIVLLRTSVTLALVTAASGFGGFRALRTRDLPLHVVRGLLLLISSSTFFYGFGHLPLADAYTIFYMVPLAMTVLAAVVLKESVPRRAALAIALGLLGVGIVVGPQIAGGEVLAYAACALGTVSYAFVGVITRRLSASETPLALLFYPCLVMVAVTLPLAPFDWTAPTLGDFLVLAAIGVLWPVAHGLFAAALKRSTIARLAPYEYSSIVWVVAVDWFVFAIAPAVTTLIGSAVIIVACLLLVERAPARREAGA
jgi:drug/metabolite transporter (DMT)-like permease